MQIMELVGQLQSAWNGHEGCLQRDAGILTLLGTAKVGFDETTRFESDTRVGQCVIFIPNDDNSNFICPEP